MSIIDQNGDKQRHFRLCTVSPDGSVGESNLARQHCPNNKESSKQSSTGQPHYSLPTCQNSPLLDICKNNESAHTRSIKAGWLWQSSPRNVAHNPSASFRPCLDKAAAVVVVYREVTITASTCQTICLTIYAQLPVVIYGRRPSPRAHVGTKAARYFPERSFAGLDEAKRC